MALAGEELTEKIDQLVDQQVTRMEPIKRGKNSCVFKIDCGDEVYVAKHFFQHESDPRDRLNVEFNSLSFLWQHGVRNIPQPLTSDTESGLALYEYVQGEPVSRDEISKNDIEAAVSFLGELDTLKAEAWNENLPNASEACFSIPEIVKNIKLRLRRFENVTAPHEFMTALNHFLKDKFRPTFGEIICWCEQSCIDHGAACDAVLPLQYRTLSPSDFGFHNALRTSTNSIVFVDFEYFGWDDPAKVASDFLLHPGMELSKNHQTFFLDQFQQRFDFIPDLTWRVELLRLLFGLKWCMIFLNEFLPVDAARRNFTTNSPMITEEKLAAQLYKAHTMLRRIQDDYEGQFAGRHS